MSDRKRQYNNTYISYDEWKQELCSGCGHRPHEPECMELEDGNPHGAFAEMAPCYCKTNSKEPYTEPPPPPPPKPPVGKLCGKKTGAWTNNFGSQFSSGTCNRQKEHDGDCSPYADCCGDRYPCYVTNAHCEFCGRNEGWCSHHLEEHEKHCAKKRIKELEKKLDTSKSAKA